MDTLKTQIINYQPYDQRETSDKALILHCFNTFPDVLTRNNTICHATASCWVVNQNHDKALMLFHNINQIWMWPGGHADGESDLADVALREVQEETSLTSVKLASNQIFSLEVLAAPPHIRRGKFVSSHLHLNCSYLLEADEAEVFKIKPDENSGIKWISFAEISEMVRQGKTSSHFQKLIDKTGVHFACA